MSSPRRTGALLPILVALISGAACSAPTELHSRCDNGATIPVTVSSATALPRFTWAADCLAMSLKVAYTDSLGNLVNVWGLSNTGFYNNLHSPIDYAHYDNGQIAVPIAPVLVAGRSYTVTVMAWDTPNSRPKFTAQATFTH